MSHSIELRSTIMPRICSPATSIEILVGPIIHTGLSPVEYSEVRQLEQDRHSDNSLRAYLGDSNDFRIYCAFKPVQNEAQIPEALNGYLNHLYKQGYKMSMDRG